MRAMGRPRTKNKDMPPGMREVDGRWYWRPTDAGTRMVCEAIAPGKASIPAGASKAEARKWWVANVLARLDAIDAPPEKRGTLAEIIDAYLLSAQYGKLAPATRKGYKAALELLRDKYGATRYARSEAEASTGAFFRKMHISQHLINATAKVAANRQISALSAAFSAGQCAGLTEYNPCKEVKKNSEQSRKRLITSSEYARIKHAATPMIRVAMLLARLTGLREGDLLALRWADVGAARITVKHSKTGFEQGIRITPAVRAVLAAAKKLRDPVVGMTVICTERGRAYTPDGFRAIWRRCVLKSGVQDVHFHDLKAMAVSATESKGRDAADMAGHTDAKTTRRVYRRGAVKVDPVR